MTLQEQVDAVKGRFPKMSKAALSLAKRTDQTGVMLAPEAREMVEALETHRTPRAKRSENRTKDVRFSCRLTQTDAESVKRKMAGEGINAQDLLEKLLKRWVEDAGN